MINIRKKLILQNVGVLVTKTMRVKLTYKVDAGSSLSQEEMAGPERGSHKQATGEPESHRSPFLGPEHQKISEF